MRAFDLRRSWYVGLPKTHLQDLAISTAINLVRLVDWLDGTPLAPTRVSAFEDSTMQRKKFASSVEIGASSPDVPVTNWIEM
jgi:hypothetical protein